jgi:serine/arginine repetitive matrix protein 2
VITARSFFAGVSDRYSASKHPEKEKKPVAQPDDDKKQAAAANADADAFRGVHLGPNVHHWDEVSTLYSFIVLLN